MKDNAVPVSLVALIPQEKTYNAQTVSSSAQSIGGSAVASVLTLGFSSKGESRQLFIHRDSDTIAFERDPRSKPTLLIAIAHQLYLVGSFGLCSGAVRYRPERARC